MTLSILSRYSDVFVIFAVAISFIIDMSLYLFVYILFMPEKGFGVRFKRYHSTLDDFTDETIENSVVSKRRKELKFSDIDLYPDNIVRYTSPVCPECCSGAVSKNGTYSKKLENGTVLKIQKYVCKRCGEKFMARLPGYGYRKHISDSTKEKGIKARVKSTLRKAAWFIQTMLDSFISRETIRKLIPGRDEKAPLDTSLHFTYDEQYVNINGVRKYRALLKDNHTHRFVEDVMENLLDDSIVPFLSGALKRFSVQPAQTVYITADGRNYDTAFATVARELHIKIKRQRCLFHFLMDVTDAVYRAHRKEQLEGAVRLLTYTLFPTEKNLKAMGKNADAVRRLYSEKTEHEIVEGMLPTIRHLYGGDSIIGKFLSALDERKKEFFLYLDDPLVSKTSNLAEGHFSMNSGLFKRKFKTKNGLLNTSSLYHEHIRISTEN